MSRPIPLVPQELVDRERSRQDDAVRGIWDLLDEVSDPEIPVLSLWDLGVLQAVEVTANEVVVTLTPTYSGCPAMEAMTSAVREKLEEAGYPSVRVELRLSPAWTTDWMTAAGREALLRFGIAPPGKSVACPQCGEDRVVLISEFASTACKALYRCEACGEPFDHFKRL